MEPFKQRRLQAISIIGLGLLVGLGLPILAAEAPAPLRPVPSAQLPSDLGLDNQLCQRGRGKDRALIQAIDHSLRYLATPNANQRYRQYSLPGIRLERVQRSLIQFRALLLTCRSAQELRTQVRRKFVFYQAIGKDGLGTVAFTGYFEPVYRASRIPTAEYRYPLYRLPPDLGQWPQPLPTRLQLEGADGLQGGKGPLRGLELVWLRDRLEAFLVQVQGSARLRLPDGTTMTIGYAGHTGYPYTGIGRELVKDGKFKLEELNLPKLIQYFRENPSDLDRYLPRNQRFVFMRETGGSPATGNLGVPVTAERSIATDRSLFPAGALALLQTQLPEATPRGQLEHQRVNRYVLDQDTGGAIIGPGRVDIFMGTGSQAGDRAGLVNATGELYYLLIQER